jgi:membrane associated rhomboid family serine protease
MTHSNSEPREAILRQCAQAGGKPWYPRVYARENGIDRDSLDQPLEDLRLAGLVQLTDWQEGTGQGYRLTDKGVAFLEDEAELARLRQGKPIEKLRLEPLPAVRENTSGWERGEAARDALLNRRRPVVTQTLVILNVLVFVLGATWALQRGVKLGAYLAGDAETAEQRAKLMMLIHDEGAVTGATLLEGQWWRLLTACFVHFGFLHLALNMYWLYSLGSVVEQLWGRARFAIIFLMSGLLGCCLAMALRPEGLMAGASGADSGILTAFAAWVMLNRVSLPRQLVSAWMRTAVINIVLLAFVSMFPHVSWEGHLGGAIGGFLVAVLLHYQRFGVGIWRWLAALGVLALPAFSALGLVKAQATIPSWANVKRLHDAQRNEIALKQAQNEIRELEKEILPAVYRLEDQAQELFRGTPTFLLRHEDLRSADDLKEAFSAIADGRAKLEEAISLLKRAGPYQNPDCEKARTTRMAHLEEQSKYFSLSEHCLREGKNCTESDKKGLAEQAKRVTEAERRWKALLR